MTAIVITPDQYYLPYVLCSLSQIARFGQRAECVVLVVPALIPDSDLVNLASLAARLDIKISVVKLSHEDNRRIEQFKPLHWQEQMLSYATYIRLLLPEVLREHDEVLYLDVDILIRAPIDNLLEWKLREPIGAVPELVATGEHLFGTSQTPYFNAGVVRMSLERLRGLRICEASQQLLNSRRDIRWYDQDVLNILFENQFDSLPLTFNVSDMLVRQNLRLPLLDDPAVVHFNGPTKPWYQTASSPFAREWQKLYAETLIAMNTSDYVRRSVSTNYKDSETLRSTYAKHRAHGHSQLSSVLRATVPSRAKASVRRVKRLSTGSALTVTRRLLSQLEKVERRLSGRSPPKGRSQTKPVEHPQTTYSPAFMRKRTDHVQGSGLDLLVSVARSGSNALGATLQSSRSDLNWMNEFYLGGGWSHLQAGELAEQYPWFVNRGPELLASMSHEKRAEAFRSFSADVSTQAVDLTEAILRKRQGRTLIKIFPEQLNDASLQNILAAFRPRLLFLRREMIFTYVSKQRAVHLDARNSTFADSWMNTDLTDVEFEIHEWQALNYVAHCDRWFETMEDLGRSFGLQCEWLTYGGLFVTGKDVEKLESFYPGGAFTMVPGTRRLQSTMLVQDRKTDLSVLALINAVRSLSNLTQAQLLRLPGRQGASAVT